MPTPDQEGDRVDPVEKGSRMQADLAALHAAAADGRMEPGAFLEQLQLIHLRDLGDEADLPAFVRARHRAYMAYEELTLGRDRHHQLELLAVALGIEDDPRSDRNPTD
jgi:hypothetical protein